MQQTENAGGTEQFSPEQQEVLDFLRSEHISYYRGDYDAFADHWHHGPEVRRILSGPVVGTRVHVGWAELEPRFKEGFRQYPQNFDANEMLRWDNVQVMVSGDLAWVSYDQVMLQRADHLHASPFAHENKILQRINGAWKIVALIVVSPELGRQDVARIELDADGLVVAMSDLAQDLVGSAGSLILSGNRPRARHRASDQAFQDIISTARGRLHTNLPRGFHDDPAIAVLLGNDQSGQDQVCWISTEQERILITLNDENLLQTRLQASAAFFGLSAAQTRLAELLATGQDLATAAETMEVSINTVKTHLRRMFDKTNTHGQTALITQLLSFRQGR